ncbi:50S ribosomal protein L18e [Candidatus Woesearchaeota archaeon]|nr:50S ribosomal protein L18e [Candidatus Woesearchaeota archaeon]
MTNTPNVHLRYLISELKKEASVQQSALWKRVATDLEKPTRQRRVVNISRLNRSTKPKEIVIVPGKVLGSGALDHEVTVAAWDFSASARKSISEKGKALTIHDLLKLEPKGKNIRIIG